jgi:cysteine desulfurase
MRQVYLDYNATTPVLPSVFEAIKPFLTDHFGNPSSSHALGLACHHAIEDAREQVAALLGADSDEIIFTGGGTESNNLAIKGVCQRESSFRGHLIISSIEHPATREPAEYLRRMGCEISVVGTDRFGIVDPRDIARALRDDTVLVSIMHANNEIGSIQPIREISDLCHKHNVLVHTDAAQSVGKIRTIIEDLGVDLLSIAGHKVYAPKGVGALYVRAGTSLQPVQQGAGHEQGLRPGTENVAFIVGLGAAARLAQRSLEDSGRRCATLRDLLFALLREGVGDELTFNGHPTNRLPNTLSVNFPRVSGSELLQRAADVFASTGAACHSGKAKISNTLASIGLPAEVARGTVRLSLGWTTSEDEIERAASSLLTAYESLKSS